MFKTLTGNLFESSAQTLVNAVNCVGVMGKGIALEFKKTYPAMFRDYAARCQKKEVRLGEPYLYVHRHPGGEEKLIVNFPTKGHWRSASGFADIERGLDYFVEHAGEWGIRSIAFPALGCGLGGLEWAKVGPLLFQKLHRCEFDVEVYAPFGTPPTELTAQFLSDSTS